MDDPAMADFVAALDPVNASADRHPGFVWRLDSEADATPALTAFESEGWLVNMSVWQDLESLKSFIMSPTHLAIMRRRGEWFARQPAATMVLWWVRAGHVPTFEEAMERLEHLRAHGPGPRAFGFNAPHPEP
ncbi:MAG: DUF3291 domain-containing protein [Xanthomonadales bacterium]|nr:DUF3291 domain-containing protein [Xanthomonadales bacterium]